MRKLGAALLAIPVLFVVYLASFSQRGMRARIASGLAASAVIGLVVVASMPPAQSAAVPKSQPQPVSAELLDAVRTGHSLTDPFTIAFAAPMEPASVAAALRVSPEASVTFGWDSAGRVLTVAPVGHWAPDTLYSVTVSDAARSADGAGLRAPVSALVLTGHAGTGTLSVVHRSGNRARLDTSFRVAVDRAVDLAAVRAALRIEPPIDGQVIEGATDREFVFRPSGDLAPNKTYRIRLVGLADADGVPFAVLAALKVRTVAAPAVVRFRPHSGVTHVTRGTTVSIRFTDRMDHRTTGAALRVTVAGKAIAGKLTWAEKDTVLVFDPAAALPYGAKVSVTVGPTALSKSGVPLAEPASVTFKVVAPSRPRSRRRPRRRSRRHDPGNSRGPSAVPVAAVPCPAAGPGSRRTTSSS